MAGELTPRGTGQAFRPDRFVAMPDKVAGKHRWIVLATYTVSAAALRAARRGDEVHMDMENLVDVSEGCIDCEQPWPAAEPCPSGDQWSRP